MITTLAAADMFLYSALAFIATLLLCIAFGDRILAWGEERRQRAAEMQRRLHRTRPPAMSVYGAPLLALAVLMVASLAGAWILGIIAASIVYFVLDALPEIALRQRARRLEAQLVDGLMGMANSLRAGMSLAQAVEQVAKNTPGPLGEEFEQILHEYQLGKTIEQAFDDARKRIDSRNFDLAVAAFRVGKERGGNVAEVFERIAQSIREIWRLEEHIRTVSMQGRSSARFMSFMPLIFLVLVYFMDPDATMLLFTDPIGMTILGVVIVFNVIGHLWIRRILAVEV
jgi:tight adherence protein B